MNVITTGIAPIILLLGGGLILRWRVLTDAGFWTGLSWMSYWVFTPALFLTSISGADLAAVPAGPLALSVGIPTLLVAALSVGVALLTRANGPQLTSLMQGSIRINTYVGLVFASALHGQEGVATFALASAIVVPLVNVICVTTLSLFGKRDTGRRRLALWRDLASNPLILSCLAGVALNLGDIEMPAVLQTTIEMIAAPALVVGTMVAGAALRFTFRPRDLVDVGTAVLLKLLALPLAAMSIALAFGITGATLTSIILITAVPTAPSATVLASRMGGDTRLVAAITGIQTVLAVATIPMLLILAGTLSA
ncbi:MULTISPECIES: AEC family transporter [unclassified Microbacterium]|uniref:AEC family transporter n=1 Tax=unclassified Microbacterium TaxID=2609290 RepID=UPI0025527EF0|nr:MULTISPECIES: AEC family transporter [unclassified Microbacterium]